MKIFLFIIVGAILAAALIYTGWIFGARSHFMTEAFSVTGVDKALTDLTMKESMLNEIQNGKTEDLIHSLQMEIDGNILTVDAFHDDMDARSLDLSRKILAHIAQDRLKSPNAYAGDLPKMDSDVEEKIKLILEQASESQTNK